MAIPVHFHEYYGMSDFTLKELFSGEGFEAQSHKQQVFKFQMTECITALIIPFFLNTVFYWLLGHHTFLISLLLMCMLLVSLLCFFTCWLNVALSSLELCSSPLFHFELSLWVISSTCLVEVITKCWCFLNIYFQLKTLFWTPEWHIQLLTYLPF